MRTSTKKGTSTGTTRTKRNTTRTSTGTTKTKRNTTRTNTGTTKTKRNTTKTKRKDTTRTSTATTREDEHGHAHGEFDPHVWMDPTLVAVWAEEIAEALAGVDPEHGADYAERADTLAGELHALDAWVRERVAAVPRDRRVLVTDHDVFGYFADRYGFTVLDTIITGFSTLSEPSARHLANLREAIAEHGVPAIFVGLTVSPHVAQVIADDLGIEVVSVYTGSLSEPDGPAATYQDFIRTNVERIVAALAGS